MRATNDVRISAVIPAYNAAAFVGRAIESALNQTLRPCEVIVVDDGSSDSTAEHVEQNYPTVRLIRQKNGGPGAARNHGVREANGDWIGLLDADDVWLPGKLERQSALLDDPSIGVVHATSAPEYAVPDDVTFDHLWRRNLIVNSSVIVRRDAWSAVGGCDEARELISVEDYNFWLRVAAAGWRIVTVREELIEYLCEPGHLTSRFERYAQAELANVTRLAAVLDLPPDRLLQKRLATLDTQGRLLLFHRQAPAARSMLFQALRVGPNAARLGWWIASLLPTALLDLRRRGRVRDGSDAPMHPSQVRQPNPQT